MRWLLAITESHIAKRPEQVWLDERREGFRGLGGWTELGWKMPCHEPYSNINRGQKLGFKLICADIGNDRY